MSAFSFPTNLSTEEIQMCLADLQIHLDASQLTKPTPEAVRLCYEQCLLALTVVTREELMQPKFAALSVMETPELHDESIPGKHFQYHITKLMSICGVKDFTSNDYHKPDATRLRRNLCAIINFAKFRDEKLALVDELEAEQSSIVTTIQALEAENARMEEEIRRIEEKRAARQAEASSLVAEADSLCAEAAQQNVKFQGLNAEQCKLKAQCNALTDQAADAKLTLSSLHAEAQQLEEEIVQSPEKFRYAIAEVAGKTENARTCYAKLLSLMNDCERKMEMLGKCDRDLQRCVKMEEDFEGVVSRQKDVSRTVKDTKEAIADEDRQASELEAAKQTARRQLTCLQEKLIKLENQTQLKVEVAASAVEEQRKRREAVEAQKAAEEARVAEKEAQIRTWRDRLAEVTSQKDMRMRAVKEKFVMLQRAVSDYNRRMEEQLDILQLAVADKPVVCNDRVDTMPTRDSLNLGLGSTGTLTSGMQGLSLS